MQKNKRAIVIVLDSFGIGELPDAHLFDNVGVNTLGHIDEYAYSHNLTFNIPHLMSLGLGDAYFNLHHKKLLNQTDDNKLCGMYGACIEVSSGCDTTSGHFEIAGCPVLFDWGYFRELENSFPEDLIDNIIKTTGIKGYLGNCHASGTEIIQKFGVEHIKTSYPIFYTSNDSVFQIACHEEYFGLDNLYKLCEQVREILKPYNIARVIARPFNDATVNNIRKFTRTKNRRDYSLPPPQPTLLDICVANNGHVVGIGKISDIYAHSGISTEIKAYGIDGLCDATIDAMNTYKQDKTIIMTNLVDFDMLYGHRRDILGYKNALEQFDVHLGKIISKIGINDILILTADHGCDPSWHGSDHTREYAPFLMYHQGITDNIGIRQSYADIGQTIAHYLSLPKLQCGESVIK